MGLVCVLHHPLTIGVRVASLVVCVMHHPLSIKSVYYNNQKCVLDDSYLVKSTTKYGTAKNGTSRVKWVLGVAWSEWCVTWDAGTQDVSSASCVNWVVSSESNVSHQVTYMSRIKCVASNQSCVSCGVSRVSIESCVSHQVSRVCRIKSFLSHMSLVKWVVCATSRWYHIKWVVCHISLVSSRSWVSCVSHQISLVGFVGLVWFVCRHARFVWIGSL